MSNPSGASPTVHGFFLHDGGLSWAQLGSNGWSDAKAIALPSGTTCSNLRVAYSPAGRLVLYGNTATGDLLTATQLLLRGVAALAELAGEDPRHAVGTLCGIVRGRSSGGGCALVDGLERNH